MTEAPKSERPPDIRIQDLEYPNLAPEMVAVFKQMGEAASQLHFNLDALMTQACEQTGLDDFGTDEYVEPLTVLCKSVAEESRFAPMGFINTHAQLVSLLVQRLRVEDFFKRHPEAEDIEISAPIIIAGLPRSGTTHLHNLIAADTRLRSLPWWEAIEPIPSPAEWDNPEPRIKRAQEGIDQRSIIMPHFDRMHEMTWDHVHEEIALLIIAGSSMQFDTMGVFPSWREYYKSQDQTPYYMYAKRILKALSFLRAATSNEGGSSNTGAYSNDKARRWVLKSPQHLEQFRPIMNTFPDASVIVTHRDPISVLASMATMLSYSGRISYEAPVDTHRIGQWWHQMLKDMLNACMQDRDILAADKSMDVLFHEFMADDINTVKEVYQLAEQEWTSEVEQEMSSYMKTHPRGRHGRVIYDLADFGLTADQIQTDYAAYIEYFNVQLEPH